MLNKIKTLTLSTAIIAFAGVSVFAQRNNLSTEQWKLTQAYGRPVTNSNAYFEVNTGRTRFTGDTGCNQMSGSIWVRSRQIDFSNISKTKRMCKQMAGSVPEATFVRGLNNAASYRQTGSTLNIYDRRGRMILKFRTFSRPSPGDDADPGSVRLEDRKWMLESIGSRRTFIAIKDAFVVFDSNKGSAGGNSGCNVFGGSYTSTNRTIAITEIISTLRACDEGDRMEVEREFLDRLRNANRFDVRDGRLFLYRNQNLLLTFRGVNK